MTTVQSPLPETHPPSLEPSASPTSPAGETGGSTPSAVDQHEEVGGFGESAGASTVERVEVMLTVEWTKLSEELPMSKLVEAAARSRRQFVEKEMDRVRRLLAAHKRLREPIRRKKL
jgi:hypothetical protein